MDKLNDMIKPLNMLQTYQINPRQALKMTTMVTANFAV